MNDTHRPEQDSEPTLTPSSLSPSDPTTPTDSNGASAPIGSVEFSSASPDSAAGQVPEAAPTPSQDTASGAKAEPDQDATSGAKAEPGQDATSAEKAQPDQDATSSARAEAEHGTSGDSDELEETTEFLAQDFESLGLPGVVQRAVTQLGWTKPSPVQAKSFDPFLSGRDVLVQSHTGSGKTGAFCLPWLAKHGKQVEADAAPKSGDVRFLAVVPTRELAKQVAKEFANLAKGQELAIEAFYGGTAIVPQLDALKKGVDVVVGTPGRLLDLLRRKSLRLPKLETVVLDECDEMLSMGFLEDIRAILDFCPKERQTGLFSATLPPDILRISRRYLNDPVNVELSSDQIAAREIDHVYYNVTNSVKTRDLLDVVMVEAPPNGIVFCNTREETRMVASVLQREGYSAEAISSDLNQSAREKVLTSMRERRLRFLVATDVAARGIDISHVTHVINYSFPNVAESYVHRTGRTGRAGKSGVAISLISPLEIGDFYLLKKQYDDLNITERYLPSKEELTAQRREVNVDRLSRDLSKPVSPEWVALARDLQKDPRGERIVAYLLSRAHKEAQAKALQKSREEQDLTDEDASASRGGFRRGREGRGRREDREARETRGEGRGGRDGHRRGSGRSRWSEDTLPATEQPSANDARPHAVSDDEQGDRSGRVSRRDRVARARQDGSFRGRKSRRRRDEFESTRSASSDAREVPEFNEDPDSIERTQDDAVAADGDAGSQRRPRRSRRRRGRDDDRDGPARASQDEDRDRDRDLQAGEDEPQDDLEARDEGDEDEAAPGRGRRRRRRRRSSSREDASPRDDLEAKEDDQDRSSGSSARRRRGKRSSKKAGTAQDTRVSQDKIIIDIDEEELDVVRDQFGEINELDDLTVKGRRRGFLDEIESSDDVVLEDLSQADKAHIPPAQDGSEDEEDDEDSLDSSDAEALDPGESHADAPSTDLEEGGEASSDATETSSQDAAPGKKRRRRRRKKRQPPPMPELTAPPHKDFWEVWSDKYSAKDFDELQAQDESELVALAEQKEQARAKRAEQRAKERQERKDRQRAQQEQRASAKSESGDAEPAPTDFARIELNIGRSQGCKSATIRKLMEDQCGLGRRSVRDLTVRTSSTLMQVDQDQIASICSALNGHEVNETVLEVRVLGEDASDEVQLAPLPESPALLETVQPEPEPARSSRRPRRSKSKADELEPTHSEDDDQDAAAAASEDQDTRQHEVDSEPDEALDDEPDEHSEDELAQEEDEPELEAAAKPKRTSSKKKSTKKRSTKKRSTKKKSAKKKSTKKRSTKKKSGKKASKRASKKTSAKSSD